VNDNTPCVWVSLEMLVSSLTGPPDFLAFFTLISAQPNIKYETEIENFPDFSW
jgi:hypothetical protein